MRKAPSRSKISTGRTSNGFIRRSRMVSSGFSWEEQEALRKLEIQINDQPLDFTLENEEYIGEVIKGIENWLAGSHLIITSIMNENEELTSRPPQDLDVMPLTGVNALKITVKHAQEVRILNLQTVLEFLSMLKNALLTQNKRLLEELNTGFAFMIESLRKHFEPEFQQELLQLTALFQGATAEAIVSWPEEITRKVLETVRVLESGTASRLQEFYKPKEAFANLLTDITDCIDEISEVSVLLQTGRDRQAMEAIIRFSELSQSLIRIFAGLKNSLNADKESLSVSGKEVTVFFSELNLILMELLEAFKAQDSVLIGDLMEYEIAPRLEGLRDFAKGLT